MLESKPSRPRPEAVAAWLVLAAVWTVAIYVSAYPRLISGLAAARLPELPTAITPNAGWAAMPLTALLLLGAYGVGRLVLRRAKIEWGNPWQADLLAPLLGMALLGLVLLLLGAARLLGRVPTILACMSFLAIGSGEIRGLAKRVIAVMRGERAALGLLPILSMVLLAVFFVLGAIVAAAPETSTDALNGHLLAPARYGEAGRYVHLGYESHQGPELAHHLYIPLWHLIGDVGPKALVFLQGTYIVVLGAAIAFDVSGRRAAWLAALILGSTPTLLTQSTVTYTDIQLALFASAALWVSVRFAGSAHGAWLAGALAGAAAASKYLGALVVFEVLVLVVWANAASGFRSWFSRAGWATAGRALLGAGLFAAPFYVKTWLMLGNPVYPLLASTLGSYEYTVAEIEQIVGHSRDQGQGRSLLDTLLLPWRMTVNGEHFMGSIGGLYLALLALLPAVWKKQQIRGLLLAVLGFTFVFSFGQHTLRWYMAALPLVAAVGACAVEELAAGGRAALAAHRGFTGLAVATAVVHLPFFHEAWLREWFPYELREIPTRVVIGGESRSAYLARMLPAYPIAARFAASAPPDARVLPFPEWDTGQTPLWFGLRLVRNCKAVRIVNAALTRNENAPEGMYEELRKHDITHLLIRRDSTDGRLQRLREDSLFGQRYLEPIDANGPFSLYRLAPRTSSPTVLDLTARFEKGADVEPKGGSEPMAKLYSFAPGQADARLTVTVLAGGRVSYSLDGVPEQARFLADVAMPWPKGDGAIAVLEFQEAARSHVLLRQQLVAMGESSKQWLPVDLDLSRLAGRSGKLVLRTDPGPAGDAIADWVGWARARIVAPQKFAERAAKMTVVQDFLAAFEQAEKVAGAPADPLVRLLEVEAAGRKEATVTLLAGGTISYPIDVPGGQPIFEADVTMPLANGDGAVAVVSFVDTRGTRVLARVPLAPKGRGSPGGSWQPVNVDLSALAGRTGRLTLAVETGPAGDAVGDWISWAAPRVIALRGVDRRVAADLFARFDTAKKSSKDIKKLEFERGGQKLETMVTLARTSIAWPLEIPAQNPRFEALAAMPLPAGDGAVAVVQFAEGGRVVELARQVLEPRPKPQSTAADPGWKLVSVDLSKFAGRRGELIVSTDPGPKGDGIADWIGWADARIIAEPTQTAQRAP
jgi:hypothetical protein